MTREEIQNNALNIILDNKYSIIEIATGVGKSFIAIKAIEIIGGKWSIIIAETNHEQNWIDEFKKHNKENLLENVKFYCYQSLHKNLNDTQIISDELHHLLNSDKRLKLLSKLNPSKFIGLSATISKSQKVNLFNNLGEYYLYKLKLDDAIKMSILPEPKIYLIECKLDDVYKTHKFHWSKDKFVMCTENEFYTQISNRIEYFKLKYFNSQATIDKNKWLKCATDRKRFLSNVKTKFVKQVLSKTTKRLICFTGSIEQSEELSEGLSIHSKISKVKRKELLEGFNKGDIDRLFATGMLKEGINLENIELGIIIQLDNQERYFTQVHGRVLRSSLPEQYVFYVKGTQDEVYLENIINNFDEKYIENIKTENLT